jgi:PadR family transcriptional regulator PadR
MNEIKESIETQMRKGIVEYCFLLILSRHRAYPSEIINTLSQSKLLVKEATAYTVLNRLRKEEKVDYEWEESPSGPPRKYYSITDKGRQALTVMASVWNDIVDTVKKLSEIADTEPPQPHIPDESNPENNHPFIKLS